MSLFGSGGGDIDIKPNPIDKAKLPFYQDFLRLAFDNMQANLAGGNPYQGRFLAGLSPIQQMMIGNTPGIVAGARGNLDALTGASRGLLGAGEDFRRNAGILSGDMTGDVVRNAGAFVNNDILRGQIDAASRDITRNLTEDVLPGINLAAAGGGNASSSRAGAASAIALRGAQDRIGDIASTMRGRAYDTGINAALRGIDQRIGANQQLGQAFNMGQSGILGATSMLPQLQNMMGQAGALQQAGEQVELDEAQRQATADQDYYMQQLAGFFPFLGLQSGPIASGVNPGDPGILGRGIGYASALAGIYGSLFGGG